MNEVMRIVRPQETSLGGPSSQFPQTQWGLVTRATDASPEIRRAGLEELCRQYWKPVYNYLRRSWPRSVEDAKDLTQAFFLWLAEEELLDRYSKEKASFRTFLKVLLKHFSEHRDRALRRLKRGGGTKILDLDRAAPPLKDAIAAPRATDPVEEFERAWRNEVVARAMERVRARLKAEGREIQFQVFEAYDLAAPPNPPSYDEVAARFGRTQSDVRNYLHAVRQLLRLEIRAELARTTSGPGELEDEWNALFGS
jgi:RNA polymerase sigma-70 factor (ECF subfamily)